MEVDDELSYPLVDNAGPSIESVDMDIDMASTSEDKQFLTLDSAVPMVLNEEDNSDSDNEKDISKKTKEEEQELTNKFLSGQLTFSEYAALYGENDCEETVEDEEIDEKPNVPCPSIETVFEKNIAEIKESSSGKKRHKGKSMKVRNSLPPVLKGLMGEANLRYAKGDHETAIKMCFEVIRQFPLAPEPFETLASLYDERGDADKSLQVSLLAAHLNPRASKHLWVSLAERSEDRGDHKQASTCYTKAIKADRKDIELYLKQAALFEKNDDQKSALRTYLKLLRFVEATHGEQLMEIAKMLAQRYHGDNDLVKAKEALDIVFEKCPNLVSTEMVNIMLEILIVLKDYKTCIEVLTTFCDLKVKVDSSKDKYSLKSCSVPKHFVIDIFAKLVIVLVHLQAFHLLDKFLAKVKSVNPEEAGDFYFEVAEALITEERFADALGLLEPLIESENYNLPAIWLRMAECLKALNRLEDSVKAYLVVVEKAPQLFNARLAASEILSQLGRREQALEILSQDEDSDILNSALLYERCQLLQNMPNQKEQFIAVVHLFLSRHFAHINNKEELNALTTLKSDRKKIVMKESKTFHKAFTEGEVKGEFSQTFNEPALDEEWQIFWSACKICLELGRFDTLQRLAFSAQGSQKFTAKFSQEIDLLCLSACYYNCDAYFGYNMVRALVLKNINCERSWNMFNMMILRADDSRHNRFLMRLLIRNPQHKALTILHANNCLVAGTYKYALSDYTSVFQKDNSAMMAFLIGVTLCQMACQKFSAKKHSLVTQSVAYFWKYKELRGPEGLQESNYNIGRAFHQLGLLPPAIHHYKKALECRNKLIEENAKYLNLQREAAFNLHLIYMSTGAREIARMYIEKYIVI